MNTIASTEKELDEEVRRPRILVKSLFGIFGIITASVLIVPLFDKFVPEVWVSRAEQKTARDEVLGIVEIKDFHTITLKFERGGIVLSDDISVGQKVREQDTLMELDTEELELSMELLQIEKTFFEEKSLLPREDELDLNEASGNLFRKKELFEMGREREDAVIDAERYLAATTGNRERILLEEDLDQKSRENDIKKIQYSLDRMVMKAPVDGTIVEVLARRGDYVRQSQPVIKLIDERRLIVGQISEDDFFKVRVGLPLELHLKAFPNTVFRGRIQQILPMSDPETRKFEIYINADIPQDKLIPGLTGEIVVIADRREDAVIVPSQAVYEGNVLKVEGNRVIKTPVQTGFVNLTEIEILDGVEAGDIVVTESNNMIKDGKLVRTRWE